MKLEVVRFNVLLLAKYKLIYSDCVEFLTFGNYEIIEGVSCILLLREVFLVKEVVELLEKLILSWQKI